ncbi:A24 family peptidase [Pseudomonas sp. G(2018)]|uniref:prepilin peptidase n=1 Tax=Pseudomonas sp. G(2018) TaxID=2502242 RepID=UPI0010F70BFA|nr:A24 family peptidase [Pseudomonas sp. G(2018)]
MSDSLTLFAVVFAIGIIAGGAINVVVAWIPRYLFRQWEMEARDILGLSADHRSLPEFNNPHSATRQTLVVIACGLLSAGVIHHFDLTLEGCVFIVLTWSLIAVSLIDADHKILPDIIVIPLVWAGLIVNNFGLYTTSSAALWGAIGGYTSLWIISWLFRVATGQEGIGHGDLKLVSVIGAWGGWQILPFTVFLAALFGILVYSLKRFVSVHPTTDSAVFPFGPYISAAGWSVMLYSVNTFSLLLD